MQRRVLLAAMCLRFTTTRSSILLKIAHNREKRSRLATPGLAIRRSGSERGLEIHQVQRLILRLDCPTLRLLHRETKGDPSVGSSPSYGISPKLESEQQPELSVGQLSGQVAQSPWVLRLPPLLRKLA